MLNTAVECYTYWTKHENVEVPPYILKIIYDSASEMCLHAFTELKLCCSCPYVLLLAWWSETFAKHHFVSFNQGVRLYYIFLLSQKMTVFCSIIQVISLDILFVAIVLHFNTTNSSHEIMKWLHNVYSIISWS